MTALATQLEFQDGNGHSIAPMDAPHPLAILNLAVSRGADVNTLERISALAREWQADAAKQKYAEAMVAIQKDMPVVVSDKHNQQTNSRYPSMERVMDTLKPIALKHGVTYSFHEGEAPKDGIVCVVGIFRHVAGHQETRTRYGKIDNVGLKGNPNSTEIQGAQKSVTYLSRRLICAEFGIVIADEDRDGGRPSEFIDHSQISGLKRLLAESGHKTDAEVKQFLNWAKVDTLEELTKAKFDEAVPMLRALIEKSKKGAK